MKALYIGGFRNPLGMFAYLSCVPMGSPDFDASHIAIQVPSVEVMTMALNQLQKICLASGTAVCIDSNESPVEGAIGIDLNPPGG